MTQRATVVGAGIAGLTSAIALAESGYEAVVLDRAAGPSDAPLGLAITGNGLEALAAIGLRDEVERAGVTTRMGSILTDAGTTLMAKTQTGAGYIVGIREGTLLRILAERADDLGVETRRETLVRSDADLPETDLVVGADGLRSTVRRWIKPRVQPDYSGAACWFGISDALESTPEFVTSWVGRGTEAGILPLDNGAFWYISAIDRQRGPSTAGDDAAAAEAAQLGALFEAPLSAHISATTSGTVTRQPLFYLPTGLPRFTSTRTGMPTLLVGDAAHAMVPSLVQGANQTFEDAAVLRILLRDEPDTETLFARFNEERVQRAQRMQVRSWRAIRWMQATHPVTGAIRNAVLKLTPTMAAEILTDWHGRWVSPDAPR